MNPAHFHLATTHAPVLGTVFGLGLLGLAVLRKSEELKRVALLGFVLAALLALPAYLSGAPASEVLRQFTPGMAMDANDLHAESASLAFAGSLVLGGVALAGLIHFRQERKLPGSFLGFIFLLAMVACGLLGWTANLGGKIRHPEIGPQSTTSPARYTFAGHQPVGCRAPANERAAGF